MIIELHPTEFEVYNMPTNFVGIWQVKIEFDKHRVILDNTMAWHLYHRLGDILEGQAKARKEKGG